MNRILCVIVFICVLSSKGYAQFGFLDYTELFVSVEQEVKLIKCYYLYPRKKLNNRFYKETTVIEINRDDFALSFFDSIILKLNLWDSSENLVESFKTYRDTVIEHEAFGNKHVYCFDSLGRLITYKFMDAMLSGSNISYFTYDSTQVSKIKTILVSPNKFTEYTEFTEDLFFRIEGKIVCQTRKHVKGENVYEWKHLFVYNSKDLVEWVTDYEKIDANWELRRIGRFSYEYGSGK